MANKRKSFSRKSGNLAASNRHNPSRKNSIAFYPNKQTSSDSPECFKKLNYVLFFALGLMIGILLGFFFFSSSKETSLNKDITASISSTISTIPQTTFIPEEPLLEETTVIKPIPPSSAKPKPTSHTIPAWKKHALKIQAPPANNAKIAIIIDDMGIDKNRTKQISTITGAITTSFITYAQDLPEQINYAKQQGKEIMLHIPMEPTNSTVDAGENVLTTTMTTLDIKEILTKTLTKDLINLGIAGANNHMGSKFTTDQPSMEKFASLFENYGLYFIDSVTIGKSVALKTIDEHHIPAASRNVFLDNVEQEEYVLNQLSILEKTAKINGYAIGIGHPHDSTITALEKWIPTLHQRNISIVPASYIVNKRITKQ